jgi:hypothetical protein
LLKIVLIRKRDRRMKTTHPKSPVLVILML